MKWWFSISVGATVTTIGTPELKVSANVDTVVVVELEEYKVLVTGCICGSSISIGDIITTTGTAEIGGGRAVSIVTSVKTCSSSSVLSTDIGSELEAAFKSTVGVVGDKSY